MPSRPLRDFVLTAAYFGYFYAASLLGMIVVLSVALGIALGIKRFGPSLYRRFHSSKPVSAVRVWFKTRRGEKAFAVINHPTKLKD